MTIPNQEALVKLRARAAEVYARYTAVVAQGLNLDMTRGKPGTEQLDLAHPMLSAIGPKEHSPGHIDYRNYGGLDGLPEARALMAGIMELRPEQVLIGGNASLALMHDTVIFSLLHGVPGGDGPWLNNAIKWICPVPGYDRHFKILAHYGVEMIPVAMGDEGPQMDQVEALVAADPLIKGMWLVPQYSNPTGATCSDETVRRLASMPTAAPDFRIFNDDAYAVHHLVDKPKGRTPLLLAAEAAGKPDRVFTFASTSKISFPGAGICAFAGSPANLAWLRSHRAIQTIGPDKLNQLRHVRFFGDVEGVRAHMRRHAAIIRPKFDRVLAALEVELVGLAEWSQPEGGYFISVDVPDGLAKRVVQLAAEAGVKLTPAGATHPHQRDPRDRNIRLSPTLPPEADVAQAAALFALCVQVALLELDKKNTEINA